MLAGNRFLQASRDARYHGTVPLEDFDDRRNPTARRRPSGRSRPESCRRRRDWSCSQTRPRAPASGAGGRGPAPSRAIARFGTKNPRCAMSLKISARVWRDPCLFRRRDIPDSLRQAYPRSRREQWRSSDPAALFVRFTTRPASRYRSPPRVKWNG
jgi:hypothetical protein